MPETTADPTAIDTHGGQPDTSGDKPCTEEAWPVVFAGEYPSCMIRVSFSSTYMSHKRFCEQLEQAARRRPAFGSDPILYFTRTTLMGSPIEAHRCKAIADRMEELAHGELLRPTAVLASRLRSATSGETPFSMR